MAALESHTARLPTVEIVRPIDVLGRSIVESIQSGLYYGALATVRSLADAITRAHFAGNDPLTIGTGGFGRLFEHEHLFDEFVPELPLLGLRRAVELSQAEITRANSGPPAASR
jgi:type III pantothenate kinase